MAPTNYLVNVPITTNSLRPTFCVDDETELTAKRKDDVVILPGKATGVADPSFAKEPTGMLCPLLNVMVPLVT